MTSLTVWRYDAPLAVQAAEVRMKALEERGALTVHDSATVMWLNGDAHPRVHHRNSTGKSASRGALLGAIVGVALGGPIGGAAAGAGIGALTRHLRGAGIDADLLDRIRAEITEGTSALLVVSSDADVHQVAEMFDRKHEATLIHSVLDADGESKLKELLGDDA